MHDLAKYGTSVSDAWDDGLFMIRWENTENTPSARDKSRQENHGTSRMGLHYGNNVL